MQGGRSVSQFRTDCFRFEQGVGSRDGGVANLAIADLVFACEAQAAVAGHPGIADVTLQKSGRRRNRLNCIFYRLHFIARCTALALGSLFGLIWDGDVNAQTAFAVLKCNPRG